MSGFLGRIVEHKRSEVAARARALPLDALLAQEPPPVRDFEAALRRDGLTAIAEIKRRSPSRGVLRADLAPAEFACDCEAGGAGALSVLTDQAFSVAATPT